MELISAGTVAGFVTSLDGPSRERAELLCARAGRRLGARVELDLDLLRAAGEERLAGHLQRYDRACTRMWEQEHSNARLGPCVSVRRLLREVSQQDSANGRSDLGAEYDALQEVAGLGEVLEALTEACVDEERVALLGAPFHLSRSLEGAGARTVLLLDAPRNWPVLLGGGASRGEVRRCVEISTAHAKWRDRRVRRLTRVRILADELWPDPRRVLNAPEQA